jgi:hypothetical protein
VLFVGVAGSGFVRVSGEEQPLGAGQLVFVPKGAGRTPGALSVGSPSASPTSRFTGGGVRCGSAVAYRMRT